MTRKCGLGRFYHNYVYQHISSMQEVYKFTVIFNKMIAKLFRRKSYNVNYITSCGDQIWIINVFQS